jgi:hypothetical protein
MRIMPGSACKPDASQTCLGNQGESRIAAEASGFLLCNPALKLHAIEALNPCTIVIRERHSKHTF